MTPASYKVTKLMSFVDLNGRGGDYLSFNWGERRLARTVELLTARFSDDQVFRLTHLTFSWSLRDPHTLSVNSSHCFSDQSTQTLDIAIEGELEKVLVEDLEELAHAKMLTVIERERFDQDALLAKSRVQELLVIR